MCAVIQRSRTLLYNLNVGCHPLAHCLLNYMKQLDQVCLASEGSPGSYSNTLPSVLVLMWLLLVSPAKSITKFKKWVSVCPPPPPPLPLTLGLCLFSVCLLWLGALGVCPSMGAVALPSQGWREGTEESS